MGTLTTALARLDAITIGRLVIALALRTKLKRTHFCIPVSELVLEIRTAGPLESPGCGRNRASKVFRSVLFARPCVPNQDCRLAGKTYISANKLIKYAFGGALKVCCKFFVVKEEW